MKGKTKTITRRTLLGRSAAAAAGALAAPYLIPSTALGKDGAVAPSDRITIGLVGIGLMMRGHKSKMLQTAETQVLAVCDVWKDKREKARDEVEANVWNGNWPSYRRRLHGSFSTTRVGSRSVSTIALGIPVRSRPR